jgi:hypothetical protein
MVVIFEFVDCGFVFFEILVFFVDLGDCDTYDVNHIAEYCCANYLNESDYEGFEVVVRS